MQIPANLAIATIRTKSTKHLRLWLVLRDMAPDGNVNLDALEARWHELGFSGVYLRQLLRSGEGGWWKVSTTRAGMRCVFPIGARRVCEHLDTTTGTRWVDVPEALQGGKLKALRAHLYAAGMFARERPVTMSRTQLQEATGLTRPTQRAAEARCGVRVQQNALPTTYRSYHEMPGGLLGEHHAHPQAAGWFYCAETGTLARRLPSTYSLPGVMPQRRTTPDGHNPHLSHLSGTTTVGTRRRWFYTAREYTDTRAAKRAPICYVRQRRAGQYALWEPLIQGRPDATFSLS